IRGIGVRAERDLYACGITSYAQIADWTADDVEAANADLGEEGRVQRENWIEQARILANGEETSFARRSRLESLGTPTAATPLPIPAFEAPPESLPASPSEPVPAEIADEGPSLDDQIATIAPLGELDEAEAVEVTDDVVTDTAEAGETDNGLAGAFGVGGVAATAAASVIDRSDTSEPVEEPQAAVEPPPPAPSPAGAPPEQTAPVSADLRSVRSSALRSTSRDGTAADDLKRIRGIGVLIERRLNAMGVTRYAEIANWTTSDIDYYSSAFDFRGRIERERWVEQARILESGGSTEFSSRIDRGEF
ncbi:MAG: hypothetical protein AAFZ05_11110, partial [Pseudomonadota bacterium]